MHKAVILPLLYMGVKLRPSQYGNHRYCKYVGKKMVEDCLDLREIE